MNQLFQNLSFEELQNLYCDIQKADEEGVRPRSLDPFIEQVHKELLMDTPAAWKHVEEELYKEVARRYFVSDKKIPVYQGITEDTKTVVIGNALETEDGEIRIATSCLQQQDKRTLAVCAPIVSPDSIKLIN